MAAIAPVEDGEDYILMERVLAADGMVLAEIDASSAAPSRPLAGPPGLVAGGADRTLACHQFWQLWRGLGGCLWWRRASCHWFRTVCAEIQGGQACHRRRAALGTDAAPIARALTRLEQVLNGEIAAELRPGRQTEPKPVRVVVK